MILFDVQFLEMCFETFMTLHNKDIDESFIK